MKKAVRRTSFRDGRACTPADRLGKLGRWFCFVPHRFPSQKVKGMITGEVTAPDGSVLHSITAQTLPMLDEDKNLRHLHIRHLRYANGIWELVLKDSLDAGRESQYLVGEFSLL